MDIFAPLTAALAEQAVHLAQASFERGAEIGLFKRASLCVVIMDPRRRPWNSTFDDAILTEVAIGPDGHKYREVATGKAKRGWETGVSGTAIQALFPFLFGPGDVKWHGDAVLMGLVVACSGVQGHFDELTSWWILFAIIALCKDEMIKREVMTSDPAFFRT